MDYRDLYLRNIHLKDCACHILLVTRAFSSSYSQCRYARLKTVSWRTLFFGQVFWCAVGVLNLYTHLIRTLVRGGLSIDLQIAIIGQLDIGRGTMEDPGYITPYSWVCKLWCIEVRKRVYRRCNLRREETADWFLEGVYGSPLAFIGFPGIGNFITILSISFVPDLNCDPFRLDLSGGFTSVAENDNYDPRTAIVDHRDFWTRLQCAAQCMTSLGTLCICYNNDDDSGVVFGMYSSCAPMFSASLHTLIIRPLYTTWVSLSPTRHFMIGVSHIIVYRSCPLQLRGHGWMVIL